MATIPSTQLVHCEIVTSGVVAAGGSTTKIISNVFQFRRTNTAQPVDKASIEAAFQTAYMVPLLAMLNAAYTQSNNAIRFLNDATDPVSKISRSVVGGVVGERSQGFDAVCYQMITGYRGKSGRGSKHFGPITEDDATADVLVAPALANWVAYKAILLGGFTDAETNVWVPCVVIKNPEPPKPRSQLITNPTTVLANDVISVLLNKTLGTMRRRKAKTVTA